MIDVVVVAPVRAYRDALVSAIDGEPDLRVTGHASTGAEALAQLVPWQPDVTLLDFTIDDVVPWVSALRRSAPSTRVVGIGIGWARDQCEAVLRAAEAGVSGFVDADQPLDDIVTAVQLAVRGQCSCSPRIASLLLQALQRRPGPPPMPFDRHGAGLDTRVLTPKERVVAELAARGLTNRQIAVRLVLGESTVKTHVHSILTKLELHSRDDIALSGALLPGEPASPGGEGM